MASKRYMRAYGALYGNDTPAPPKHHHSARICPTEAQEQIALVAWARAKRLPIIAIPNAAKRSVQGGALQKALGLSPGFPDLVLWAPRRGHGAMCIEMKRRQGSTVQDNQWKWIEWLNANGYYAVVAYGCDSAIKEIELYLSRPLA